ncbi:AMP-binding protein [Reichenbachiella sp. MALMAid0571]|uniref:AMP-binding protein n=1 Tax=Reichenbachiella sp. MALMAid0571 TaxID=3143939 RepID=UPI0032DF3A94
MKDHSWYKQYPEGIPHEIDPDQYSSLVEVIKESFNKYSELPAFENMGKSYTYAQIDEMSDNFAAFLQNELKLAKGDRIALQMPNLIQYPVALFGSLKAGLVVVNTNPLYTQPEMQHQFKDSGAKAIVILANFAYNLEQILPNTNIEHVIVTEIGDLLGGLKGMITNFVVKKVKKMVPAYNIPKAFSFKECLSKGSHHSFQLVEIDSEDLAFLQYTGGTTGVSKGAMLTHRNVTANLIQVRSWISNITQERKELIITALPLYHIFALVINGLITFSIGAKNVLITNPRDIDGFVKELAKHQFTMMTGVNTLFNALLNHPKFSSLDFSKLTHAAGGGMAVQRIVAEKWKEVTGKPLLEGYGLTETSPVLTFNPTDGTDRIGTIGVPAPSTEICLLDDSGNEVPIGERGEICAKGPQVMKGYWQRPKETEEVFINGWFRTGDIGVMDEDGFIKIVDRKKEMILVSGFNVYPNDIENTIASHPKVLEVGAIGVPDSKSTEAVKVFIVKKEESLTIEEIQDFCKKNLTGYKRPKHIEFLSELPKSNVGKVLRRILKEEDTKRNTYS